MKKTIFLIFLFFLYAQIASAADVIADDLVVQGDACIGVACPTVGPFPGPLGNVNFWVDSATPQILMRDTDAGATERDFAFFVDNNKFGIYNWGDAIRILGIEHTAPADSIYIGPTGDVGLGTSTPGVKLDIVGTAQATFNGSNSVGDGLTTLFDMSANNTDTGKVSDAGFLLENDKVGFQWAFRTIETTQGFMATKLGTGGPEFEIRNSTSNFQNVSLQLGNGASCSSSGQWIDASSRDYKENIQEITSTEAMKTLKGLQPVKYNFKRDPSKDPTVGFIAEDVPDLVATNNRKGLSPLEIVAVLTKVVQEQQALVAKLSERITELEKQ